MRFIRLMVTTGFVILISNEVLLSSEKSVNILPLKWLTPVANHTPISPNEHPRLLFRKSDISELRKQAATAQGQKAVAAMKTILEKDKNGFQWASNCASPYNEGTYAAGYGFLYTITGDKKYAERAKIIQLLAITRNMGEWGAWGTALRDAYGAIAYDLCYDAWDPDFRRDVASFYLHRSGAPRGGGNVGDVFSVMWQASFGLAALAIIGDTFSPVKPKALSEAYKLPPPAGFTVGSGVPVVPFSSTTPTSWICAKAFEISGDSDPLASIGGRVNARPSPGTSVTTQYGVVTFKAIGTQPQGIYMYKFATEEEKIINSQRADDAPTLYAYLYTVIDNDTPRTVKAMPNPFLGELGTGSWGILGPTFGASMWVAGRRVYNGDLLDLDVGKYPLLVELPLDYGLWTAPALIEYNKDSYSVDSAQWAETNAKYVASGNRIVGPDENLDRVVSFMQNFLRTELGEKGLANEQANVTDMFTNLLPFAQAYMNVMGKDLITGTGIEWVVPFQMYSRHRFWHNDWGDRYWVNMGFKNLVSEQYRGVLRWYMDNTTNFGITQPNHGMLAIVNYPWNSDPVAPKNAGLPLYLWDSAKGGLILRSGWDDATDFTTVITARSNSTSCFTAGDFSIYGRRAGRWTGFTPQSGGWSGYPGPGCDYGRGNVIRFKDALPQESKTTFCSVSKTTGSGILTLTQNYWAATDSLLGGCGKPKGGANLGISALRSIAVDYSGAAGVPVLIAIVDKVSSGSRQPFQEFNFTSGGGSNGNALAFTSNGFTATAKGTPAVPEKLTAQVIEPVSPIVSATSGGPRDAGMAFVKGGNAYFTIITIQSGEKPALLTTGSGLDSKVRIGSQTVSFDGNRIVLGVYDGKEIPATVGTITVPEKIKTVPNKKPLRIFDLRGRQLNTIVGKQALPGIGMRVFVAKTEHSKPRLIIK